MSPSLMVMGRWGFSGFWGRWQLPVPALPLLQIRVRVAVNLIRVTTYRHPLQPSRQWMIARPSLV
ncbi:MULTISPECIES: hypothetical protein [Pseudomonas]|uniref:hypothetical protein n=1 Tax=Pseudomonas TaxID=286 RepID=UPI0021484936|nr:MULTISPECIES: hypothetical protein [Pseudomonas]UUT25639.1 hypothetical protein NRG23_03425 [Pseudomonas sp. T8]WJV27791.1 hypothetical protein PSR66_10085 [Pseudomonas chlororaphis]